MLCVLFVDWEQRMLKNKNAFVGNIYMMCPHELRLRCRVSTNQIASFFFCPTVAHRLTAFHLKSTLDAPLKPFSAFLHHIKSEKNKNEKGEKEPRYVKSSVM